MFRVPKIHLFTKENQEKKLPKIKFLPAKNNQKHQKHPMKNKQLC
jgi:hypothetical protein